MAEYTALIRRVAAGEVTAEKAAMKSPQLRRKESVCPCSKSVRWVDTNGGEKLPGVATRERGPGDASGDPGSPTFHAP
jgi:hypothetical protein